MFSGTTRGMCRFGGWSTAFQAEEMACVKLRRYRRIHTSFTSLIKELYSNSVLPEYVEWEDGEK